MEARKQWDIQSAGYDNVFWVCSLSACDMYTNNSTTGEEKVQVYIGVTLLCLTVIKLV